MTERAVLILAVMAMAAVTAFLMAVASARAHGPWPVECCHDRDCIEVPARFVVQAGNDIVINLPAGFHPMAMQGGRWTTNRSDLKPPVTGEWGVCISPAGTLMCVFPPFGGS